MSKKKKMHVQSVQKYGFSLSNMQICGVFVAVVVVRGCLSSLFCDDIMICNPLFTSLSGKLLTNWKCISKDE